MAKSVPLLGLVGIELVAVVEVNEDFAVPFDGNIAEPLAMNGGANALGFADDFFHHLPILAMNDAKVFRFRDLLALRILPQVADRNPRIVFAGLVRNAKTVVAGIGFALGNQAGAGGKP